MKAMLRKVARRMANWPVVGRLVQIGNVVRRLPQLHELLLTLNHRQHVFETEQLPLLLTLNHRQHVFETEQLPSLLRTLSEANRQQVDFDNLIQSVPMVLRNQARDLAALVSSVADLRQRVEWVGGDLGNTKESVDYLLGRVEFVRRELMFEMRYGAKAINPEEESLSTKTEVLSPEKLETARETGIRVNLGCGHIQLDGYLNVDRRALPGVDIVSEVDGLPFGKNELSEIFSAHLLEHFPEEQLRRELLPYFFGLLKGDGVLKAVVPDAEAMMREYSNGNYPYEDLREVLYGGQDYDGDFHFNMFTPDSMIKLLTEAGFKDAEILEKGRKNGRCYEFEIQARKPVAMVAS
jgi:predicted SAM-dependent methyltransferase